jgi:Uncharacterized conserved protein (DUF2285)
LPLAVEAASADQSENSIPIILLHSEPPINPSPGPKTIFVFTPVNAGGLATTAISERTVRLVQSGLALMRGGYRGLLRPKRKDQ